MTISILTLGVPGPAGPASLSAASVITARGSLAVGNAAGTPVALTIGSVGKFLRSDGSDPSWQLLVAADLPSGIDAAKINTGVVTNTKFNYLSDVTSLIQAQLAGKAALAHNHLVISERGVYFDFDAASGAAPSDNTASTSVWATGLDLTTALPTGTWTIRARMGMSLLHSAAGDSEFRVSVDNEDTTARLASVLSSTLYTRVEDTVVSPGHTGTKHIKAQFRTLAGSAGTTSARNPVITIDCWRTS